MMSYDTAKLVNVLLNLDGHSCRFLTTRYLHHVGGISGITLCETKYLYTRLLRRCSELVPDVVWRIATWAGIHNGWRVRLTSDEKRHLFATSDRRRSACEFVNRLLCTLSNGETQNVLFASTDTDLDAQMRRMEILIRNLYPTWRAWLDGREPIVARRSASTNLAAWPTKSGDAAAA